MADRPTSEEPNSSVPERSRVALLLVDVINDFEFQGAEKLFARALSASESIAVLRGRVKRLGIPVVYANDNFGKWQSNFKKLLDHCLNDSVRGRVIAERLQPDEDDYFVLKPKHSAFFSSSLEVLLQYLGARTLIVCGFAGNICVLLTAGDAYLRGFRLLVPSDCFASEKESDDAYAQEHLRCVLNADTGPSTGIDLESLIAD